MNTVFTLYLEALGLSPAPWQIKEATAVTSHKSLHIPWQYLHSNGISTSNKVTTTHTTPRNPGPHPMHQQQSYQQLMNAVAHFQVGLVQLAYEDRWAVPLSRFQALPIVTDLLYGPWRQVSNHNHFPNIESTQAGSLKSVVLRKGRTVSFLETTLYNDRAQLIAHSQHTFQLS